MQVYPCAEYPGVAEVIKKYLKDTKIGRVNHAAIAIANPVDGDQVSMTNHDWSFSIEATRRALGFDTLLVVNDFTALAMALPRPHRRAARAGRRRHAPPEQRDRPARSGHRHGRLGPDSRRRPLDRARQRRRPRHLRAGRRARGHRAALRAQEVVACVVRARGRGPRHGSDLSCARRAATRSAWRPTSTRVEIVKRALEGEPLAAESADVFCGILGTFAGNIAVTLGALGGIYIGGGVVPRLGDFFARSSFRKRFEAKGRFEAYLQNVPTYVITAEYPAFLGVSAILAEQLSNRAGGSSSAVFERIRQMRDALTPAERRVADLALNHPRSIINDPIVDIARKADVSQPTVIRFCRSLGCRGLAGHGGRWPRWGTCRRRRCCGCWVTRWRSTRRRASRPGGSRWARGSRLELVLLEW